MKAEVKLEFNFPDHHDYTKKDLVAVQDRCKRENIDTIITTQKDAVRLKPHLDSLSLKVFVCEVELEILKQKSEFFKLISDVCRS